jgi:hypothetical protein
MNPWNQKVVDTLIASLLLSVLTLVVVAGIILVYLVLRWRRQSGFRLVATVEDDCAPFRPRQPAHAFLKRPQCWLAVRSRNVTAVQTALALHDPKPCSWVDGLAGETHQRLFVSPPVQGWILVMGSALPDPTVDVDECYRLLVELSRKLGHVQYFHANSVLNQHAWAQAESGRIRRAYAWAGTTLWNEGAVTDAEIQLRMKCYAYAEPPIPAQFGYPEPHLANPEKVHSLAARWSVDPGEIDERFIEQGWGVAGEPSRRF